MYEKFKVLDCFFRFLSFASELVFNSQKVRWAMFTSVTKGQELRSTVFVSLHADKDQFTRTLD